MRANFTRLAVIILFFSTAFIACTKIDETELGNGLIPPVDNINTFDTLIDVIANSYMLGDSIRVSSTDAHIFGVTNGDPAFGTSEHTTYMELFPDYTGAIPFKDSVTVLDSVMLNLQIAGYYGDTLVNQLIRAGELQPSAMSAGNFYRLDTSFTIAGPAAIPKQIDPRSLKDTVIVLNKIGDTSRRTNVIRLKLDNSVANRLFFADSNKYKSDSSFRTLFGGLAIYADRAFGGKGHFKLFPEDPGNAIEFYYKSIQNGKPDTAVTSFHFRTKQANAVKWDPSGSQFAGTAPNPAGDSLVYIQSTPGTYVLVKIPSLPAVTNRVVHRAELIIEQVADNPPFNKNFLAPGLLHMEAIDTLGLNKFLQVPYDFFTTSDGPNFSIFGGYRILKTDVAGNQLGNYFFNITAYVQGVITRHERNYDFRIFAPYYRFNFNYNQLAEGRMVAGGTKHSAKKMRLRIIYSKL